MSDIITGAISGAELGSLIAPGVGTAIGGIAGGLLGGLLDASNAGKDAQNTYEQAGLQGTEASANISIYQKYLDAFPGYSAGKTNEYQTKEAQDLGDRLAAMGMRGISMGKGTSAAAAYGTQKSLFDQGYTELVTQLALDQGTAEAKLGVYQASLANATKAQKDAQNSIGGFMDQAANFVSGKGWTM